MNPESRDDQDAELQALLEHLLESGRLQGAAAGITRQVLARGEKTLSERQEWVYDTQVRAEYLTRVCGLCEDLIPLSEVLDSLGNGGLCAACARILGKDGGPG
jgi:hypothetical protein